MLSGVRPNMGRHPERIELDHRATEARNTGETNDQTNRLFRLPPRNLA